MSTPKDSVQVESDLSRSTKGMSASFRVPSRGMVASQWECFTVSHGCDVVAAQESIFTHPE
jgi:hypothetical protein